MSICWDDVLTDYTGGIIFAYAETLEEARQMVLEIDPLVDSHIVDDPKVYGSEPTARVLWGGG